MPTITNDHIICNTCDEEHDILFHEEICPDCKKEILGCNNVSVSKRPANVKLLQEKYTKSIAKATKANKQNVVQTFKDLVAQKGEAVICASAAFTMDFLLSDKSYKSYTKQYNEENRIANKHKFEQHFKRVALDYNLYGPNAGEKIIYAALSINGLGLSNYGNCHWVLNTANIENRTTAITHNSFIIHEQLKLNPLKPLNGYLAHWNNKGKLAVNKHVESLIKANFDGDFATLLLKKGTNKTKDEFIELHIFGEFKAKAVKKLYFKETKNTNKRRKGNSEKSSTLLDINILQDKFKGKLELIPLED